LRTKFALFTRLYKDARSTKHKKNAEFSVCIPSDDGSFVDEMSMIPQQMSTCNTTAIVTDNTSHNFGLNSKALIFFLHQHATE